MHNVAPALKAKVEARINECIQKIGVNLPPVKVKYDINSSRLGGQASYAANQIRINPVFLNAYTDHYLETTVAHETAHLIARAKYGRMINAHGPEWKQVMRDLGVPPNRCHSYETPEGVKLGKQTSQHECVCSACSYTSTVGPRRARKMLNGVSYRHRGCNGKVTLKSKQPNALPITRPVFAAVPKKVSYSTAVVSKLDLCRRIMASGITGKDNIINAFVSQAGCTVAGANTYYYKLKA